MAKILTKGIIILHAGEGTQEGGGLYGISSLKTVENLAHFAKQWKAFGIVFFGETPLG
jgi:hypothetical protein